MSQYCINCADTVEKLKTAEARVKELEAKSERLKTKLAKVRRHIGLWYDTGEEDHINDAYESAIIRDDSTSEDKGE